MVAAKRSVGLRGVGRQRVVRANCRLEGGLPTGRDARSPMEQRRVTLADIAKRADVHVTTVSLAMRNHPRLPEETRKRIQALAEEMGYRPDPMMRALVACSRVPP